MQLHINSVATKLNNLTKGIPIDQIYTHSICARGVCALKNWYFMMKILENETVVAYLQGIFGVHPETDIQVPKRKSHSDVGKLQVH